MNRIALKGLLLAILLFPIVCVAQSKFYIQGIIGQYSMKGMKKFQEELNSDINESGYPTEVVTDFPLSLQVELGFDRYFGDDYSIGVYLNYAFTKGRIHYRDYSGEMYSDQDISRIVLGGKASKFLDYGFSLYGKAGLNYSMMELQFVTDIYGAGSNTEGFEFYSIGVNIEPGISWLYSYKNFSFSTQFGYELNLQGKTMFKESEDAHLLNQDGDKVIIDWSGLRLGLSLAYILGK